MKNSSDPFFLLSKYTDIDELSYQRSIVVHNYPTNAYNVSGSVFPSAFVGYSPIVAASLTVHEISHGLRLVHRGEDSLPDSQGDRTITHVSFAVCEHWNKTS